MSGTAEEPIALRRSPQYGTVWAVGRVAGSWGGSNTPYFVSPEDVARSPGLRLSEWCPWVPSFPARHREAAPSFLAVGNRRRTSFQHHTRPGSILEGTQRHLLPPACSLQQDNTVRHLRVTALPISTMHKVTTRLAPCLGRSCLRSFSTTRQCAADHVRIVEVGPRDGLQNEKKAISLETKLELIRRLAGTGITHLEAGSFVPAKWVPQVRTQSLNLKPNWKNLD